MFHYREKKRNYISNNSIVNRRIKWIVREIKWIIRMERLINFTHEEEWKKIFNTSRMACQEIRENWNIQNSPKCSTYTRVDIYYYPLLIVRDNCSHVFGNFPELVRARSNSLFANHPVANVLNSYARQIARHNTPPRCPWRNDNRIKSIRLFLSFSLSLSFPVAFFHDSEYKILFLSQRNVSTPTKKEKHNKITRRSEFYI